MVKFRIVAIALFFLSHSLPASVTAPNEVCAELVLGEGEPKLFRTGFLSWPLAILGKDQAHAFDRESARLRKAGNVFALTLEDPSESDIEALKSKPGVFLGPAFIDWVRPAISYEAQLEQRENLTSEDRAKRRQEHRRKLRKTEPYSAEVAPLTDERFQAWYPIFKDWVLTKEFAVESCKPDFAKKLEEAGHLADWAIITLRSPEGKVVGGVLISKDRTRSTLTIRRAAFDKTGDLARIPLALRTYEEAIKLAQSEGFETFSYGTDPALHGEMVTLGLERFKAALGFEYRPSKLIEKTRFIQILNQNPDKPITLAAYRNNDPSQPLVLHVFGEPPADHAFPHGMEIIRH